MRVIRHILVPTDFSDPAAVAEDYAVELASKFGARITLAHVHQQPAVFVGPGYNPIQDFASEALSTLKSKLEPLKNRWPDSDCVFATGTPWEQILAIVRERAIDLVVMGTHGRRGVARVLLGSVAEKVVRLSSVPVLTVGTRGPKESEG